MVLRYCYRGNYAADATYQVGDTVRDSVGVIKYYVNPTSASGHATSDPDYWLTWGEPGSVEQSMIEQRLAREGYADVDARLDNLLERINERCNYGVVSGLVVAQQTEADMTVKVSAGVLYKADGTRQAPAAVASIAVTAADATNPRKDIVYVSSAGAITYLAGTAAASPSAPAVPAGGLNLAEIAVAAEATTIVTANITDKRRMIVS